MGFKILTLEAPKMVVWECIANPNPAWLGTHIKTVIKAENNSSKVIFSHEKFDKKWAGEPPFEMTKTGWDHFISSLKSYCETGTGQPW